MKDCQKTVSEKKLAISALLEAPKTDPAIAGQ